jgi:hypothetical protein
MQFSCPICGTPLSLTEQHFGRKVRCPGCPARLRIPNGPGAVTVVEDDNGPAIPRGETARTSHSPAAHATSAAAPQTGVAASAPVGMPPVPAAPPHAYQAAATASTPGAWGIAPAGTPATVVQTPALAEGRPLGLVWIVFFFCIQGICLIGLSFALVFIGSVVGAAFAERGGSSSGHFGIGPRERALLGGSSSPMSDGDRAIASLLTDAISLSVFHFGLLLLVAGYGLWTARTWGPMLAAILSALAVLVSLVAMILALVARWGILSSIVAVVIWIGVAVYLGAGSPGRWIRLLQQTVGKGSPP